MMQGHSDLTPYDTLISRSGALKDVLAVVGGSLFLALCAQLAIRLPFSPVPITAQTFAVLILGALLGSRRGALSVAVYLAEGVAGLPFFAGGGSGPLWLLGPTGGYLAGFVAAAWVVGWLSERLSDGSMASSLVVMLAGNATIYLFGLPWLARFVAADGALSLGLLPFLPGDLIKIGLAALVLSQSPLLTNSCGSKTNT
jgi:biotin transport system substrate-specific component